MEKINNESTKRAHELSIKLLYKISAILDEYNIDNKETKLQIETIIAWIRALILSAATSVVAFYSMNKSTKQTLQDVADLFVQDFHSEVNFLSKNLSEIETQVI